MQITFDVIIEFIAVITGLLYTLLAGRNKLICWSFAIVSALIYVYINFNVQLYFFALLQSLYVVMAIYGWLEWKKASQTVQFHFIGWKNIPVIIVGFALSFGLAYLAKTFTAQRMPYFDAINFVFCLIASYMITQKMMESWIYLLIVDAICVFMYFEVKLYQSAILYLLLTILAINAFWDWMKQYKLNNATNNI